MKIQGVPFVPCQPPSGIYSQGCKTSLTQGCYTWRHNQVLKSLASTLEDKRRYINALQPPVFNPPWTTAFVREGAKVTRTSSTPSERGQLCSARDWKLLLNIDRQLVFPPEIATTTLRPDLVLWFPSLKKVYIIELTVPWEDAVEEAYEQEHLRYAELAAEAQHQQFIHPVWLTATTEATGSGFTDTTLYV